MGNATSTYVSGLASDEIARCASPAMNHAINCSTAFTNDTNLNVSYFGNVTFGQFEGDPDIAGTGTLISFIAPSAILFLCTLVIILSRIIVVSKGRDFEQDFDEIPSW
ncbi:hypothetical protein GQ53DRAFT_816963 [Thozetella sp. PMI_491]|nr:hypothetical protein GQ53DRAFT_816963 [Thozetella sp. PMI_491]